jgi:uncharacterized membrane protein YbjE (DUF340 family)
MKVSLLILASFVAGIVCSVTGVTPRFLLSDTLSAVMLYVLVLLVGMGIGASGQGLAVVRRVGWRVVLVPAAVVAGTLGAAALVALAWPGSQLLETLAVASGFGYYSLSSVIIKDMHGATLGATALLANMAREVTTLVIAPLLTRRLGKLALIGCGGATSMDTTLPIVTRFSGREYAAISIFSGLVLSLLVPFIVPLLLSLS